MAEKQLHYDAVRELLLARVHDGHGNLYVFNVPEDVKLSAQDVLRRGELIAIKEKGKACIKIDSTSDQHHRTYNNILPLELDLPTSDYEKLILERRKTAPIPGNETPRSEPVIEVPPPVKKHDVVDGKTVLTRKWKDKIVHFVEALNNCVKCGSPIPGTRTLSKDVEGKFTRIQKFIPDDKGATCLGVKKGYHCAKCAGSSLPAADPVSSPPDASKMKVLPPRVKPAITGEIIQGFQWFKFEKRPDGLYYKGNPIVNNKVVSSTPCHECQNIIDLQASISYKDGKPWLVSSNKPINRDAIPISKGSPHWKHMVCPSAAPPIEPDESKGLIQSVKTKDKPDSATLNENPAPTIPPTKKMDSRPDTEAEQAFSAPVLTLFSGNPLSYLETLALDEGIDDKIFRGAAWMLARALNGGKQ